MAAPKGVGGTRINYPVPRNRPRRRKRLVNLSANRGANQGAPNSDAINVYPFPFQGLFKPARHGHYPVFGVGLARRVGAWRAAGPGTLGGRHQRSGRFQ